jgi:hypothetical protein
MYENVIQKDMNKFIVINSKCSKSLGEFRKHNMLMAIMKLPDCLKWPETPQASLKYITGNIDLPIMFVLISILLKL